MQCPTPNQAKKLIDLNCETEGIGPNTSKRLNRLNTPYWSNRV